MGYTIMMAKSMVLCARMKDQLELVCKEGNTYYIWEPKALLLGS